MSTRKPIVLIASLVTCALAATSLAAQNVGNVGNNSDTQRETRPGVVPGTVIDGNDGADGTLPGPAPAPATPERAECERLLAQAAREANAPAATGDEAGDEAEDVTVRPNVDGTADPEHALETEQMAILEECRELLRIEDDGAER